MRARLILGLLLGIAATSRASAEARVACIVLEVQDRSSTVHIERGGDRVAPAPYLLLWEQDRVFVTDPRSQLVARCGARDLTISSQESPLEIRFLGAPPSIPENLRRWVMDFLTGSSEVADARSTATSLSVRGEEDSWPLEVPILTSRSTKVGAGRKSLAIGWRGGARPYAVRLYDDKRRLLLAEARALAEPLAQLELAREIVPGSYELEVTDASGRYVRGEFDAVARENVPNASRVAPDAKASDPIATTLRAAWVASDSDGIYALEGYQMAASIAASHQPAALLLRLLRMGHHPRPPELGAD